jgi:hypothetical protein
LSRLWTCFFLFCVSSTAFASDEILWRAGTPVPAAGRSNPYDLNDAQRNEWIRAGREHALRYPVDITGLQIPEQTLARVFAQGNKNPILALFQILLRKTEQIESKDDIEDWLGLATYPETEGVGAFFVPFPDGVRPIERMGSTTFASRVSPGQMSLTYSCAACHAEDFFGHRIIGLTTRFPRANDFFLLGKQAMGVAPGIFFDPAFGVAPKDVPILRQLKQRVRSIEGVAPLAPGLDTSLALVGLSLSMRQHGGDAAFDPKYQRAPRPNILRSQRADSKPAVWWNVKYKNRWLSDGSVVSGNPIFTNFLWNEIGRGSDMNEFSNWLADNQETMQQLTTAVFAAEPPRWTDIFGERGLDLERARRGEPVYAKYCASCHGSFVKAWSEDHFAAQELNRLTSAERIVAARTTEFRYHEQTPVMDVGTDPARYQGMRGLLELNALRISKIFQTVIEPQRGYVPPPLIGIFSRYPYLHNNSVPSLCELLTPAEQRASSYLAREARDPERDFDFECVGYPVDKETGEASEAEFSAPSDGRYRAGAEGLRNTGHDQGIFMNGAQVLWTHEERRDLIEFLKTL